MPVLAKQFPAVSEQMVYEWARMFYNEYVGPEEKDLIGFYAAPGRGQGIFELDYGIPVHPTFWKQYALSEAYKLYKDSIVSTPITSVTKKKITKRDT